jgi:hypothetical protein
MHEAVTEIVVHTDRQEDLPDCVHQIVFDKAEASVDGTKNETSNHSTNLL